MNKRLLLSSGLLLMCVVGAVNFSFSALAKGGDHCGVDYKKNLKSDFSLANGTVTIRNTSDDCDYTVGLASYKVYYGKSKHSDAWLETQTLHDSKTAYLDTKQSVTLQVALPDCRYQLDAFRGGQVVQEFERGSENNERGYKDRLLDAGINDSKPLCSSNVPTPTAVPTVKPTATPTVVPTKVPTVIPTKVPTATPTLIPTKVPTATPTTKPSVTPTAVPTHAPTATPTATPTAKPSATPTPTNGPTATPTPTMNPSHTPTPTPTNGPTATPTVTPTNGPTATPTTTPVPVTPTTVVINPTVTPTPVVLATTKGGQPVYEVKGATTTPDTGPEVFALISLVPAAFAGAALRRRTK